MSELHSRSAHVRSLHRVIWFLLGCVPFCGGIARLAPDSVFWSDWSSIVLFLVGMLLLSDRVRHRPLIAAPVGLLVWPAVGALICLQIAIGMTRYPVAQVQIVMAMAVAFVAGLFGKSILDASERGSFLDAFCAGGLVALALNAAAVVVGLWGYEILLFDAVRTKVAVRAVGLIGQSNHLGTFAVLSLAGAIYLHARRKLAAAPFWFAVLASAFVCAASGSRTALGLWVLMMLMAWLARMRSTDTDRTELLTRGELWLMTLLFIGVQMAWVARTELAPEVRVSVARGGAAGRTQLLVDAAQIWTQHPVLGVGQGNYAQARLHDLVGPLTHSNAAHAHNIVAQALAEWGTIGTLVILAAGGVMVRWGWRALRAEGQRLEGFVVATWIVSLIAHSQVEHPLWFMRFLLPFALMIGLLGQPALRIPMALQQRRPLGLALFSVFGLLLCGLAAWDYGRLQALTLRVAVAASASPDGKALVPLAEAANVASLTMFPRYAQIQLARALPLSGELATEKLDIARHAMDSLPDAQTIACYAAHAVVARRQGEAYALLSSIRARSPALYADTLRSLADYAAVDDSVRAFAKAQESPSAAP